MAKILSKPLSLKTARQLDKFEHQQTAKNEKNTFTAIFFAKFSRAYALQLRVEAQRRATLLILAIHAHHAKHRKWPKSLDQIDKDLGLEGLDQARIDPFSGNDFIYKLRGGEPLLYSVSSNGEDDGGRHEKHWGDNDKDSDYVFWPLQR